ncbi:glycosyltransferase [Luteimonas sp. MJ293]|uniref:glycosyltransferase n=1 Tax=Luteimonas sp. MJ146 TaxID=3129240 RepID=UPI0031BAA4AE
MRDHEISDCEMLVKQPVVSVLMMAYNHAPYIERAIQSVLEQASDCRIELLIGEDRSQDETLEIAKKYQARHSGTIRILTAAVNVGAGENYRRLIRAARGEFIAYLDGDDYWLPGKLVRQLGYLRAHLGCVAVFTNAVAVNEAGRPMGVFNDVGNASFDLASILRRGNFLNNSSVLFDAKGRDLVLGMSGEFIDYQVHLALAQRGRLDQIGEMLVAYRVNAMGSMLTGMNEHVRKRYWQAVQSVPRELVSDADYARGITDFLRRVFFRSIRARDPSLLRAWAARIYAASPYGARRTTALVAANIMRMIGKMTFGRLRGPRHRRVLYLR